MVKFASVSESQVTNAIVKDFCEKLTNHTQTEVVIVGGGPSGLIAGRDLARAGVKVLIIESNNYLGGGFWIGGYLMNGVTFREPANEVLDELGVPYKKADEGLYIAPGPHACSKLIASACDAGVTIINMTRFDDVVLREGNRVAGVVINWTPVAALPRAITCVDPVAIEAKIVIDATGHDASVVQTLVNRDLMKIKGFSGMWVDKSEDMVVEKTQEVYPGLVATGMSVATVFGTPRMGPTFGGMLLSGRKAAVVVQDILSGKTKGATVDGLVKEAR
ncbi:MAG: sulfide-dependent adenosine diphosphate thiazole synthase [Candidatus Omnitrophota bacterium]